MKRKNCLFIIVFLCFRCFGNDFQEIKLTSPRINNKYVTEIQSCLNKCNLLSNDDIDGWYGPITENAILKLQELLELPKTGTVNLELYSLLNNQAFQDIVFTEITYKNTSKIDFYDEIYDGSGWEIYVYTNEKNEIYKYVRKYWRADSPSYNRDIKCIETYYFSNDNIYEKLIKNPNTKDESISWTFTGDFSKIKIQINNLNNLE